MLAQTCLPTSHLLWLSTENFARISQYHTALPGLNGHHVLHLITPGALKRKPNLVHNLQYLTALHQTRSQIPKVVHTHSPIFVMEEDILKNFEALRIESRQKLPEHEALDNVAGISKIDQSTTLPPKPTNEGVLSTPTDSHQRPPVNPSKLTQTTRKQEKAAKAQEVTADGCHSQPDRGSVSPQQASNTAHHLSSQGQKSSGKKSNRSQRRQYHSKASGFVHQSPSTQTELAETESLAHSHKVSLSTKAAAANLTLPVRSGRPAALPPQKTQAFPSTSANFRGRGNGRSPEQQGVVHKFRNSDELIHIPAPEPTKPYSAKANTPASRLPNPQSLLLVLDLNGTLLFRTTMATRYVPRPGLRKFLDYCFANHSVLIWSSARPHNVIGVCKKVFTPVQQSLLLGQWGRDTFGLNPEQYKQRVQVYKNLDIVWGASEIQSRHPNFATGGRWGQENTVLIDDSALKAAAQPFNLINVPEFIKNDDPVEAALGVLEQVESKLEELRRWDNVSAFVGLQQAGDAAGKERGQL